MTYFNKNKELKRGYNAYIDESTNYMGTQIGRASCRERV